MEIAVGLINTHTRMHECTRAHTHSNRCWASAWPPTESTYNYLEQEFSLMMLSRPRLDASGSDALRSSLHQWWWGLEDKHPGFLGWDNPEVSLHLVPEAPKRIEVLWSDPFTSGFPFPLPTDASSDHLPDKLLTLQFCSQSLLHLKHIILFDFNYLTFIRKTIVNF